MCSVPEMPVGTGIMNARAMPRFPGSLRNLSRFAGVSRQAKSRAEGSILRDLYSGQGLNRSISLCRSIIYV